MTDTQTSLLLAGVGGLLPTLSKIAASFAAQPDQPLPHWHILVALAIFFIIGVCLNIPYNKENDFAKAVVVGIAAPALITNIIAGATNAPTKNTTAGNNSASIFSLHAVAQERSTSPGATSVPDPRSNPTSDHIQINLIAIPTGKYGFPGVTQPLRVSYTTADGQSQTAGEVSPGGKASFIVPASAREIRVMALSGASAAAPIPSNSRTVNITAEISIAPKNDFLWALGARREGAVREISLNVTPGG
jgi:hypothetical protein